MYLHCNICSRRRAKPLTNGTASDDTDSSMTPKKSAALSKAIQKGKLGKEVLVGFIIHLH